MRTHVNRGSSERHPSLLEDGRVATEVDEVNDTLRSMADRPAEEAAGRPSVTSALADKNNEGLPHLRKPFV